MEQVVRRALHAQAGPGDHGRHYRSTYRQASRQESKHIQPTAALLRVARSHHKREPLACHAIWCNLALLLVPANGQWRRLTGNSGNQWRTFRKLIRRHLTEKMCDQEHLKIVDAEVLQLARDYMLYPEQHMKDPNHFSNSITNTVGM